MLTQIQALLATPLAMALLLGGLGLVVALVVVPLIISRLAPPVAHLRERQFHQTRGTPVPRLGGIALAIAFVLTLIITFFVKDSHPGGTRIILGVCSLAMFGLGLWDDIIPLGAKKKLLGQIVIATAAFYFGLRIEEVKNPLTGTVYLLGPWACAATVLWLIAMTNLINLIDGIDGLATGICLMLMCLLVYVSFGDKPFSLCVATGMVGALIGVLRFNFPPARIYLGDGGAYFLGFLIGGLTIQNSNKGTIAAALIAPIIALGLPILDVAFSIVRRGMKGLPIFRPDRGHIHHRLLQRGLSRRGAVLTMYGISLVFLALAFVAFWSGGRLTPILVGCGFVVLLITVPSLGLIKNWLTVGTAVGNSLEMRKEIQYALMFRTLMEMEAERSQSLPVLWNDFRFTAEKMGFTKAVLTHRGARCSWASDSLPVSLRSARHELQIAGETVVLDLFADQNRDQELFKLQSELAAETWQHAMRRWTERNEGAVRLPGAVQESMSISSTVSA
jgi:UDP-GlcNAc:undecaprenyl-phosphate GlcNAc-1-phosphate transferase